MRISGVALLLMLTIYPVLPGEALAASSDESAVLATETAINQAIGRADTATLETLWAPDYTFVNPAGQLQTRAKRLALLRSGELKVENISYDEYTTRFYGDTAVVTARSTVHGQRKTSDISNQRRVTSVFVKRDGRWQVVAQQSTRIERP